MIHNRRRSDVLVNTYHLDAIFAMTTENRKAISADRNSVVISSFSHKQDEAVRFALQQMGIDKDVIVFHREDGKDYDDHCIDSIKKLMDLGYDHGFHFDSDKRRIDVILKELPGLRIVRI